MKKTILIGVTALGVALLVFVSCLHDPDFGNGGDEDTKSSARLTKEEAQSEFERHFADQVKTRSGSDSKGDLLVDFDYTPLWYDGKLEHNDYSSLMTVPILTDRVMYVGYYGDGGGKPTRVARVTQELHIVKNFEKDIVMPTVKTVVPLNGIVFRPNMRALEIDDYYRTRSEVTFYQTLDGRIITTKLIEDGVVTVIAYIREDAESYREKMSRVYSKLQGYGYTIGEKRIATRGPEDWNDSNAPGSGKTRCSVCQGVFDDWDIGYHFRTCNRCDASYRCGDDHQCPWCTKCQKFGCKIQGHKQTISEVEVTVYGCDHCKTTFETMSERNNHYCYCQTCQDYFQFYSEFNPHVCMPKPNSVCAECHQNPCICNQNPGGSGGTGGGSNSGSTNSQGVQRAKDMFRNSNLSLEGWEILARALDKIIADCMGGELYNALLGHLKGGTIIIELNPASNNSAFSYHYGQGDAKITWGIKDNSPSNSLLHEMLHAYKTYQNDYTPSSMNEEIEVRMAQYLYLTRRPEFTPDSRLAEKYRSGSVNGVYPVVADYLDKNGNLINHTYNSGIHEVLGMMAEIMIKSENNSYRNHIWNDQIIGADNFKTIQKLSKGC